MSILSTISPYLVIYIRKPAMRTIEEYNHVLELHKSGLNNCQIARKLDVPRCTVRDMIKNPRKRHNDTLNLATLDRLKNPNSKKDETIRKVYSYLLGMYLGDGSIVQTKAKRNLYRLRITLDAKYPDIISSVRNAVQTIMSGNKTSEIKRFYRGKLSCIDISCWSNDWVLFFPFYRPGKKHTYKIDLEEWQKNIVIDYPRDFWLGLYHSDGSRYTNMGKYISYNFTQKSKNIFGMFMWACDLVGVECTAHFRKQGECNVANVYQHRSTELLDIFAGPKT